jgi:hypothetical protein
VSTERYSSPTQYNSDELILSEREIAIMIISPYKLKYQKMFVLAFVHKMIYCEISARSVETERAHPPLLNNHHCE